MARIIKTRRAKRIAKEVSELLRKKQSAFMLATSKAVNCSPSRTTSPRTSSRRNVSDEAEQSSE